MPVDPKTGEKLPYASKEEEYMAAAESNMPSEEMPPEAPPAEAPPAEAPAAAQTYTLNPEIAAQAAQNPEVAQQIEQLVQQGILVPAEGAMA